MYIVCKCRNNLAAASVHHLKTQEACPHEIWKLLRDERFILTFHALGRRLKKAFRLEKKKKELFYTSEGGMVYLGPSRKGGRGRSQMGNEISHGEV